MSGEHAMSPGENAGRAPVKTRRSGVRGRSFSSRNPTPIGAIGLVLILVVLWAAFNADKLPLIGPHVDDPHLLLATGHEGLGITTSMGTARLIADHLAGRTPEIEAAPYLPARLRMEAHAHA